MKNEDETKLYEYLYTHWTDYSAVTLIIKAREMYPNVPFGVVKSIFIDVKIHKENTI